MNAIDIRLILLDHITFIKIRDVNPWSQDMTVLLQGAVMAWSNRCMGEGEGALT